MVSYRTLVFGTIAVISASAPAVAGGLSPLPAPHQQSAVVATPGGLSPLPTQVKPQQKGSNIVTIVLDTLGRLEQQVLHLHH